MQASSVRSRLCVRARGFGWGALALSFGMMSSCGGDDSAGGAGGSGGAADAAADSDAGADVGNDTDAEGSGTLGAECAQDSDCVAGLACWRDEGDGGLFPAHGLCTVTCDDDEAKCDKLVPGAACRPSGSATKRCFEPCERGTPKFTSLTSGMPDGKCHGRNDMACHLSPSGGQAMCYPTCNDDSACGAGKCNAFGFCTMGAVASWDDIGQPALPNSPCSTQISSGTTPSYCTATCTIGVVPSCTWAGAGTVAKAACLLGSSSPGQGDRGSCSLLCDCDADCPVLKCNPLLGDGPTITGRKGVCGTGSTGILCADAGTDAGDASDPGDAADAAGD